MLWEKAVGSRGYRGLMVKAEEKKVVPEFTRTPEGITSEKYTCIPFID
jgi:hypothetical protein